MPNIRLTIEYNGAGFHGWQRQPGLRTIQQELLNAIKVATREHIKEVTASGRTDAGVHAKAQVVNFHIEKEVDLEVLKKSISSILKGELSVIDAQLVDQSFHSRFDSTLKTYKYTILNRSTPAVLDRGRVWEIHQRLNFTRLQSNANLLEGIHDFKSFQGSGCAARTTTRTILKSSFERDGEYLIYTIIGKGFLKQMVRNIVGTLVDIERGSLKEPCIKSILACKDRRKAGVTAPAYGLCLESVCY